MIEELFTGLTQALTGNPALALASALAWGVVSILLSPCHLSSIPLIIGFISNQQESSKRSALSLSIVFSLGILVTIAAIGAITAAMGRLLGDIGEAGNYLVAVIFFVSGLYLMDVIKIGWGGGLRSTRFTGFAAAFVLGLVLGVALGPCAFAFMAPVLAIVFEQARTDTAFAIGLLAMFALGHSAVIAAAGAMAGAVQKYLTRTNESGALKWIKRICGVLVILAGVYMLLK